MKYSSSKKLLDCELELSTHVTGVTRHGPSLMSIVFVSNKTLITGQVGMECLCISCNVHAFVTSCVDYCNAVLAGAPRYITDKFQRVLNTAARLVTGTRKFDRGLERILHDDLHWLDVPERVQFKLGLTVRRCL